MKASGAPVAKIRTFFFSGSKGVFCNFSQKSAFLVVKCLHHVNFRKTINISLEVSPGFLTDDTSRLRVPFMSKKTCDISAVRRMLSIWKGNSGRN